jgi:hypothetical protein
MKFNIALTSFALALALSNPVAAETLNNESVLALIDAGLGDEVVIAKIKSSTSNFELSTDTVIKLRQRGVSGQVLVT